MSNLSILLRQPVHIGSCISRIILPSRVALGVIDVPCLAQIESLRWINNFQVPSPGRALKTRGNRKSHIGVFKNERKDLDPKKRRKREKSKIIEDGWLLQ